MAGTFTAVAVSAVGLIPMDSIRPHLITAAIFFCCLLSYVASYLVAAWPARKQQPIPFRLAAATTLLGTALLVYPKATLIAALADWDNFQRPDIWPLACLEWALVLVAGTWLMSLCLIRPQAQR
jgi:hypothetical protein